MSSTSSTTEEDKPSKLMLRVPYVPVSPLSSAANAGQIAPPPKNLLMLTALHVPPPILSKLVLSSRTMFAMRVEDKSKTKIKGKGSKNAIKEVLNLTGS